MATTVFEDLICKNTEKQLDLLFVIRFVDYLHFPNGFTDIFQTQRNPLLLKGLFILVSFELPVHALTFGVKWCSEDDEMKEKHIVSLFAS